MISIKEAAIQHCNRSQFKSDFPHDYHSEESGFNAGVEFAQRWIPVEEELPEENYHGYVNLKIGDYVSCKKVDSQIEFLNLIDAYGFTHWRPIEYK